jgi:hypothetical protein
MQPGSFRLGTIVRTREVAEAVPIEEQIGLLLRHAAGDFGSLCAEDVAANEAAILRGDRILSLYPTDAGDAVYVITEADRSATTILFRDEY